MAGPRSTPMDPTNVRFRLRSIVVGSWLTIGTVAVFAAYFVASWDRPHRPALLALALGAGAFSVGLQWMPLDRVVRSRLREPFFLGWSALMIALIAVAASFDGGVGSPLTAGLFLPLAFGALSYPLKSMVGIGVLVEAGFFAIVVADGGVDTPYLVFYAGCLAMATWMCAWQSRNHGLQHRELERVSRADPLTGCLNRRGLEERLAADLSRAARTGRPLGLILLDLDGFKAINDERGHAAGDALLRWTVAAIDRTVRPMDAVGRIGGDEFAVVLPDAGRPEAAEVAGRLREVLAEAAPASVGLAAFPADGTGTEELHQHADSELYAEKRVRAGGPQAVRAAASAATPRQELSWAAALARAVDVRLAASHDHSRAVAEYAVLIGRRLGWDADALGRLRLAGILHDVGKSALPDAILRKPGPLDEEEWLVVRRLPIVGADMVARIEGLEPVAAWIRAGHEHVDGSGYPAGLRGDDIPLASRVLLVADAYDAMTSERVYRPALGHAEALAELRANAGTQFDAECVEHLVAALDAAPVPAARP
jgi:diguanylate cyclase (GGDEF)-like protein